MKSIIYWVLVCIFTFIATIIGLFLIPFCEWSMHSVSDYCAGILMGSTVLLVLSITLIIIAGNRNIIAFISDRVKLKIDNKDFNRLKKVAMAILPIPLALIIPTGIHLLRFDWRAKTLGDCLVYEETIYTKFGIPITAGIGTDWIIAYDEYGDELLINYRFSKEERGNTTEIVLDYNGECKIDATGRRKWVECDSYKVNLSIVVYDKKGNSCAYLEDSCYYTFIPENYSKYKYRYNGQYYSYEEEIISDAVRHKLSNEGIKVLK